MNSHSYQVATLKALKILAAAVSLWLLYGCNAPGDENLDDDSEGDDIGFTASAFATES